MIRLRRLIDRLPIGWTGRVMLLRLSARWRSLVTAALGVVLVAMIGASVPLYTAAIAQIGMVQRLDQQAPKDVHIQARISLRASEAPDLAAAWSRHDAAVARYAAQTLAPVQAGWVAQPVALGETSPLQAIFQEEDLDGRLRIAYYQDWEQITYLLDGAWPAEPSDPAIDLEAAIGQRAAEVLGVEVGDDLVLDQRGWDTSRPVRVRITAVIDLAEGPYAAAQNPLRVGSARQGGIESNLLTTREGFLRVAGQFVPDTSTSFGWWVFFDHDVLPYARLRTAVARAEQFHQDLLAYFASDDAGINLVYQSALVPVLEEYEDEVGLLRAPFGLLLLQVGALALFFLVVTAALVRRGMRREIAMLQTRGAAHWHILLLDGLESLVIGVLATAVAPFLAQAFLEWIVPFLTRIESLDLSLDWPVFAFAGAAGAVSWLVLVTTLIPILRLPLTVAGGTKARSEKQLWWQRYYLDVALLVVGVAALWRLITSKSPLTTTQMGEIEADPLLLLAPMLLFVAVGSMLLRLFANVTGLVARLLAHRRRLTGVLAAWQVSREPAHYGRITFLLTLAIGIGWLATSFHATLVRSQRDRAAYAVGADMRLEERDEALSVRRARPAGDYLAQPAVAAVSRVGRFPISNASPNARESLPGELLAVDGSTFGAVSYWRGDLGELKLPPAPDLPVPGRALESDPVRVGVWVRLDQPMRDRFLQTVLDENGAAVYVPNTAQLLRFVDVWARLRTADGPPLHVKLEPVDPQADDAGWFFLEGALPADAAAGLRLEGIYWRASWHWEASEGWVFRLSLTDLTLTGAGGTRSVLDWLATDDRWELLADYRAYFEGTTQVAAPPDRAGGPCRQVLWRQDGLRATMGLMLNYPPADPIPAIASPRFAEVNGLLPGTTFQVGTIEQSQPQFRLVDTAEYYPTLYPDRRLFLVVDQRALLYALNRRPSAMVGPSEAWLALEPGADAEDLLTRLDRPGGPAVVTAAHTFDRALDDLETNMLLAGLIGLLYLAFGVALALTIISLLTYVALTAMQRRVEFGVLRALGLSTGRLVTNIALEQVMVMAIGVLLGVALGAAMSAQVLPTLAVGATGETITPPFVIRVEATALAQYGLLLCAVLGVTFGASLVLVRRLSLADLLRFGEE